MYMFDLYEFFSLNWFIIKESQQQITMITRLLFLFLEFHHLRAWV